MQFTAAELFVLAGVAGAHSVSGIEDPFDGLLPEPIETQVRAARSSLLAKGALIGAGAERWLVAPAFRRCVASLAHPRSTLVIGLDREGSQTRRTYFRTSRATAEAALTGPGTYELRGLDEDDGTGLVRRIANLWALPPTSIPDSPEKIVLASDGIAGALEAKFGRPRMTSTLVTFAAEALGWAASGLGVLWTGTALWRIRALEGDVPCVELTETGSEQMIVELERMVGRLSSATPEQTAAKT